MSRIKNPRLIRIVVAVNTFVVLAMPAIAEAGRRVP